MFFTFYSKFNITLIPQWIPREQNELAGYYNRIKNTDNLSIDNDSFRFERVIFFFCKQLESQIKLF